MRSPWATIQRWTIRDRSPAAPVIPLGPSENFSLSPKQQELVLNPPRRRRTKAGYSRARYYRLKAEGGGPRLGGDLRRASRSRPASGEEEAPGHSPSQDVMAES